MCLQSRKAEFRTQKEDTERVETVEVDLCVCVCVRGEGAGLVSCQPQATGVTGCYV